MSFTVIVGSQGRMSQALQNSFHQHWRPFKLFSPKAPVPLRVGDFKGSDGVIDFSSPDVSRLVVDLAFEAKVPLVCGTTGWKSPVDFDETFLVASKTIPIVWDSNFSLGIEMLSQVGELIAEKIGNPLSITDIHHMHKKDAPSGTALKLAKRIQEAKPGIQVSIQSVRLGEIPGEHRILASFEDETLEFTHRAHSRRPFSEGAMKALKWAQKQKPGLYSMKDVLT